MSVYQQIGRDILFHRYESDLPYLFHYQIRPSFLHLPEFDKLHRVPIESHANRHHYTLMQQFESHDVFHVLLGYSPTTLDEACMQYCLIGSGKKSSYAKLACLGAILIYPEYAMLYYRHYQRGKTMKDFASWDFEALLSCDLHQLRQDIQQY